MLNDKLLDLTRLGANDRTDLAQVNTLDSLVDDERLGKQAEHAVQAYARAIQKGRDGHDADIDQQQGAADLERRAALEDHGENVGAARRGTDVKDDGTAQRRQDNGKAQVEPHIARQRNIGRNEELKQRNVGRKRKRSKDTPKNRLAVQEDEAENDQDRVDDPHKDAYRQGRKQCGQDNRHTRSAAEGEVVGSFKRNNSKGCENQTQIKLGKKARKARLLATLATGALATLDNIAIDHALHRHHGRTMYLLGGTRRRLRRGGLDRPCLAFCLVLVGHYGNPSLTIWKQCAH